MDTVYAIRHRPSGLLLPRGGGFDGRGGTHVEPSNDIPRLFRSLSGAKQALRWWLKGVTKVYFAYDFNGDGDMRWTTTPKPNRIPAEMEIVRVNLNFEGV